jgi:hypothetical protein
LSKGDIVVLDNLGSHKVEGVRQAIEAAGATLRYPDEIVEMALAHAIQNKVKAAYFRTDLFDKRRVLMEEWAVFCQKWNVVSN